MKENTKVKQLEVLLDKILKDTPFEIVMVEFKKTGPNWVLRVLIDHPDGVNLDRCATVSQMISAAFEEDDPISQSYHLEVSSPGIDRPLNKPSDYRRFIKERAYVKSRQLVDGRKSFTGPLLSCSEQDIEIRNESDGKIYKVPLSFIAKATLKPLLEF